MSKWKQRFSIFLIALFTVVTFMGNIPIKASKLNTSKKKTINLTQRIKKIKKSKKILKNKKNVVPKKGGVKKQQNKKNILKTTEKKRIKDEFKTPKVITFITPGVIRGGKSVKLPQNINGDAKFTAEKITYNNGNISRDLYISADNCTFNNVNVNGAIYVDPGENGNATLNNIICSELKILSGGKNSIHLNNVKVNKNLLIKNKKIENSTSNVSGGLLKEDNKTKDPIRVEIKGQTSIQNTQVSSNAILDVIGGSFGNINILETESEKNIIEFRGIFDKTVLVQSPVRIKTASGVILPEIQIIPNNKTSKVLLEGNFKNVIVNKEAKVDIAANSNIDKIFVNIKSSITIDKTANIKKIEDKFNSVNKSDVALTTSTTPASTSSSSSATNNPREVEVYIRVEGYNHTIIPRKKIKVNIFDLQPYLSKGTGSSATKSNGWNVDKFKAPTVAHAIAKALNDNGARYDFQDYGWSCYMAMINGDREKEKGQMSGWMYRVDGKLANIGCQAYTLSGGENILWYYGSYGFDNLYTNIYSDKNNVKTGEAVIVTLEGETNDYNTFKSKKEAVAGATILVNGSTFLVNGEPLKTDSNGRAVLRFNKAGKYEITATRVRTKGKESGYIDIIKPEAEIINVNSSTGGNSDTSNNVKVDSLSIENGEIQIAIGEIKQLIAKINPENASNKRIMWKSSDESVANVDVYGKLTGLKIGEAVITATTEDGNKTASCKIKVLKEINVREVKIDKNQLELQEGETSELKVLILPDNSTNKNVKWKSSDEAIAKVDENGKVTGVSVGETTLNVITEDGSKTAICKVKVTKSVIENADKYKDAVSQAIEKVSNKVLDLHNSLDWTVLGLARAGKMDKIPSSYLKDIEATLKNPENIQNFKSKPTEYERMTLGVISAGGDPTNVGGINLIEKICNADLKQQGINALVFGLIALDTKSYKEPDGALWTREKLINEILKNECSNKETIYQKSAGWAFGGDNADSDMTGMAMTALAPYYNNREDVKAAIDRAVEWLSYIQREDGGYASWGTDNSESCAQVIMGLCANKIDPTGAKFTKNGKNVIDVLLTYQCEDGTFGHINTGMGSGPNGMATEQALYALDQFKYFIEGKGSIYYWGESIISHKDVKVIEDRTKICDKTIEGNLYISGNNCEVNNVRVKGTIYVDPGKEGTINITNTTTNDLKVLSGGKNSIHLYNVIILKNLVVDTKNEPVRVEIKGETKILETQIKSSVLLEANNGSFGDIKVTETKSTNTAIEFKGIFDKPVIVESGVAIKTLENTSIHSVKIEPENKNTEIILEGKVNKVEVNKEAKVELRGEVETVNVNNKSEVKFEGSYSTVNINKEAKLALVGAAKIKNIKVSEKVIGKVEISKSEEAELKNVEDINKRIEIKSDIPTTGGDKPTTDGNTNKQVKIEFTGNTNIRVGNKPQLKANIIDQSIKDKKIIWISSDDKIAYVDNNGKVITMGPGTVVITAAIEGNDNVKDSIKFNVRENKVNVYIRVEGYNHTIIPRQEFEVSLVDLQPLLGKASGSSAEKSNGWGVDKFNGPTVAHAIVEDLIAHGFTKGTASDIDTAGKHKFDIQDYGWSCYVAMIDGDREKDKGQMSGWMYRVNNVLPSIGAQAYELSGGEEIVWYYGSYGYKNLFTKLSVDRTNIKTGENINTILKNEKEEGVEGASILVNGKVYRNIKTNSKGEAVLSFDTPGQYTISANRIREKGNEAGYIDIVRPVPITINVERGSVIITPPGGGGTEPTNPTIIPATGVALNENSIDLREGDTVKLTVKVQPENATNQNVTWNSSNENVAKVDVNGNISAISVGKALITVTTVDGNKTARCSINVNKKDSGSSSETDSKVDELSKVTDTDSGTSLSIQRNKDKTIKMILEGKALQNDTIVTITLFNSDNDLKYIGQAVIKNGKLEFNTNLEGGKYHGFYNVQNSKKVKIEEFEVK